MIILEGADGSGKTTAGKKLAALFDVPFIHSPGYNVEWWMSAFAHHTARPGDVVIYDRFYFSEFVYGPILRGECRVEKWFEEYAAKVWFPTVRPLVIYCHIPPEKARETVEAEAQMEGVKPNLEAIQQQYDKYFSSDAFNEIEGPWILHYDWTRKPLDVSAITSWVEMRRRGKNVLQSLHG